MNYVLSNHAKEEILKRGISVELIEEVLQSPNQILVEDGIKIYQSIIFQNDSKYLLRVFVNDNKIPSTIITVYLTNKILKYYKEFNEN
ncbi:MAG TPA: DUF4258 domain-containing protein [Candidatus Kapabacteria bacterium]|nr:DUF4258 domain-containing protein [Candidatus Kapabacteria bacterium]